jgi:hypothetical protein
MNPLSIPIFTLIRPFSIVTVEGTDEEKARLMKYVGKEFFLSP